MNFWSIAYLVMGISMFMGIVFVVAWVAGKDILMAFYRRFRTKGCDVFIANSNRNISHYYKVPKDNKFKIGGLPYVTNPEKTMNLSDADKDRIIDALKKREERLKQRITSLQRKKQVIDAQYKASTNPQQKFMLQAQSAQIEVHIKKFQSMLRVKQENYFKDRRPAFFYIEGDPVPKDFYEYYSEMDSKILDNLLSRAISQAPSQKTEQDIKLLKMFLIGTIGAAVIAAFLAYRNMTVLEQITKHFGIII